MKKFAKLIALVLALVLVLSLAACKKSGDASGKTPTSPVGKWVSELAVADMIKASGESSEGMDAESMKQLFGDSTVKVNLELTSDGKIILTPDKDSFKALFEKMTENIADLLPTMFNVSPEKLDEMLQAKGMTKEQLVEQVKGQFNPDEMFGNLDESAVTGVYEIDGDKIYLGEEGKTVDKNTYIVFTLSGNKLTLKDLVGSIGEDLDGMKAMFPWEFTYVG